MSCAKEPYNLRAWKKIMKQEISTNKNFVSVFWKLWSEEQNTKPPLRFFLEYTVSGKERSFIFLMDFRVRSRKLNIFIGPVSGIASKKFPRRRRPSCNVFWHCAGKAKQKQVSWILLTSALHASRMIPLWAVRTHHWSVFCYLKTDYNKAIRRSIT